jgi:Membrane protein involved in colicin uptake
MIKSHPLVFFALFASALSLSSPASLGAQSKAGSGSPVAASAKEGFSVQGSDYVSVATAQGSNAQDAEQKARSAALRGLFAGLGKDRLFAEVFTSAPPLDMSFRLLSSSSELLAYKATVQLRVDSEAVHIIERGAYLAAAVALLDKAEAARESAGSRKESGAAAETKGELGGALTNYGQAIDSCRSALSLVDPVADPGIFSSAGKRTAPELKKDLAAFLAEAQAGVERVKKAEAALAVDQNSAAVQDQIDVALAMADAAQAYLDGSAALLADLSVKSADQLAQLREGIDSQRRSVADAAASLDRAKAALPKEGGFVGDKLDFAKRRVASVAASLDSAYKSVDREIRDPADRRAARAKTLRWIFLHEPREYVSARAYLPFEVGVGDNKGLRSSPFEFSAGLEAAYAFDGRSGIWLRSRIQNDQLDLLPTSSLGEESSLSQFFDVGFFDKKLYFAGYGWDWERDVDGRSYPKPGSLRLGIGGVYPHGSGEDRYHRADWLAALSYDLPYASAGSGAMEYLNGGLETQFRMGQLALFEASASEHLHKVASSRYVGALRYSIGLGLRLPPPFAIGVEFGGSSILPLASSGDDFGAAYDSEGSHFRFYLQYSL